MKLDTKRAGARAAVLVLSLAACGRLTTTSIRDINDQPATYEGRTVTIAGDVVDATNLLVLKYYRVEDPTGRIVVVAKGAVPAKGNHVRVQGTVHQAFALGDQRLTVLIESEP